MQNICSNFYVLHFIIIFFFHWTNLNCKEENITWDIIYHEITRAIFLITIMRVFHVKAIDCKKDAIKVDRTLGLIRNPLAK